jgi:hypothetical protein
MATKVGFQQGQEVRDGPLRSMTNNPREYTSCSFLTATRHAEETAMSRLGILYPVAFVTAELLGNTTSVTNIPGPSSSVRKRGRSNAYLQSQGMHQARCESITMPDTPAHTRYVHVQGLPCLTPNSRAQSELINK